MAQIQIRNHKYKYKYKNTNVYTNCRSKLAKWPHFLIKITLACNWINWLGFFSEVLHPFYSERGQNLDWRGKYTAGNRAITHSGVQGTRYIEIPIYGEEAQDNFVSCNPLCWYPRSSLTNPAWLWDPTLCRQLLPEGSHPIIKWALGGLKPPTRCNSRNYISYWEPRPSQVCARENEMNIIHIKAPPIYLPIFQTISWIFDLSQQIRLFFCQ